MSLHKVPKLPPLQSKGTYGEGIRKRNGQITYECEELKAKSVTLDELTKNWHLTEGSSVFAGTHRKPQFLLYLEDYLDKKLQGLNPVESRYQRIKLRVYQDAFCAFIKEFKTYQPFLSAVQNEYENTLAFQDAQLVEMEKLRSNLRHATEASHRTIQACSEKEQAKIEAMVKENEKLQQIIQSQLSNEEITQTVVNRLQSELSQLYVQYREEYDARRLLIRQLNNLSLNSTKNAQSETKSQETIDPVELQLSLKVCRQDLTKTQEELIRFKAEYWDVVPRRDWDALEKKHNQTCQQLKMMKEDLDLMKAEYDTLLELHKKSSLQMETHLNGKVKDVLQTPNENTTHRVQSTLSESGMLLADVNREDQMASTSIKSEKLDSCVVSVVDGFDNTQKCLPSNELYTVPEEPDIQMTQNSDSYSTTVDTDF